MRLIDADALETDTEYDIYMDDFMSYSREEIRMAPAIDAVPVVRCKDCKHRPIKPDDYDPIATDGFVLKFPDEKCPCQCGDGWYSKYPDDDWFCADGERKGGEEK